MASSRFDQRHLAPNAHTRSKNCHLPSSGTFAGSQMIHDCNDDKGCNYLPPAADTTSYGDVFNAVGGGVYALEWTSDAIKIWHFPRTGIPQDIIEKVPDPSSWGAPQALLDTSACDMEMHFSNMSIVLNIVSNTELFQASSLVRVLR